jgi:hypothetical protein
MARKLVAPSLPWGIVEVLSGADTGSRRLVESVQPAVEHQVARTATVLPGGTTAIVEPGEPPSDTALRVVAALTGLWIDQEAPACRPDRGEHWTSCPHRERWMTVSFRRIAMEAFGRANGTAIAQVHRALDELASKATRVMIFDPDMRHLIAGATSHIGEYRWVGGVLRWAWSASTLESLLAGGYQRLPRAIVQELSGSAFYVWQAVLTHPATALGVRQLRASAEFSVTGPSPSLSLRRLGLSGLNRPAKVRDALRRACARGNEVQGLYRLTVLNRSGRHGGLKLRVTRIGTKSDTLRGLLAHAIGDDGQQGCQPQTRTLVRPSADCPRSSLDAAEFGPAPTDAGAAPRREHERATPGTEVRHPEDRGAPLGGPGLDPGRGPRRLPETMVTDGFQTGSIDSFEPAREAPGGSLSGVPGASPAGATVEFEVSSELRQRMEEIVRLLEDGYNTRGNGHPVSSAQRRLILAIESRGLRAGCELDHAELVREAFNAISYRRTVDVFMGAPDPLEALKEHDEDEHPRRRRVDRSWASATA